MRTLFFSRKYAIDIEIVQRANGAE
jgi:hypothetical protein